MALNERQVLFVERIKEVASLGVQIAQKAEEIKQQFDEEFDDAQDNSLLNENTALIESCGFDSTDVKSFKNQFLTQFTNFWEGSAVTTREYGKEARRVAKQYA